MRKNVVFLKDLSKSASVARISCYDHGMVEDIADFNIENVTWDKCIPEINMPVLKKISPERKDLLPFRIVQSSRRQKIQIVQSEMVYFNR